MFSRRLWAFALASTLWPNARRICQLGSLGVGAAGPERLLNFGNVLPLGSSAQWRVVVAFPIAGLVLEVRIEHRPSGGTKPDHLR